VTRQQRGAVPPHAIASPTWLALAVFGVAVAAHARALGNGFVWDDRLILSGQLVAFRSLGLLFFPPADIPQYSHFYYRPVVFFTYLTDNALGGGTPLPFHLTSILLDAAVSSLVLLLLLRLLGRSALVPAMAGALAFAVHPVHAEVVAWMSARGDALATLGVLVALLSWSRWLEGSRAVWLAAGGAGLLFGLLAKESAIVGIPLAAALPWITGPTPSLPAPRAAARRAPAILWAAIASSALLYLVLRAAGAGFATGMRPPSSVRAVDLLGALGFYFRALLWPRVTGVVLTAVLSDPADVLLGLLAVVSFVAGALLAVRRRSRIALWALAWIALGLVPPLALVVRAISETPVADRYLYLPSVGAALLVGLALARLPRRWERAGVGVAAAVLLAWTALTVKGVAIWRDDLRFWNNAVAAAPAEGFARLKLAVALARSGDAASAEAMNRSALEARLSAPQLAVVQNNLGWLLMRQGRREEAEPLFRAAVEADPGFAGPYRGLAECLWPRGNDPRVRARIRDLLERAVRVDPHDARSAFLLGGLHLAEGEREGAAHWFERAIRADPASSSATRARAELSRLHRN
jgi:hypothetical protein